MATVSVAGPAAPSPARQAGAYDRLFYGGMALALGLTVLAGFASTYYLRFFTGGPRATLSGGPFTTLVHVHGALFTAWVVLFIVQTALVASRRVAVHRRLGVAGAGSAAAMVVAGTLIAIAAAARGSAPRGSGSVGLPGHPALRHGPVRDLRDRRTGTEARQGVAQAAHAAGLRQHRRGRGRSPPGVLSAGPPAFFGLSFLFVVVAGIYDFLSRRRVHKVYLWGGAIILLSVPVRLAVSGTGAWRALAELLTN